MNKGTVIAVGAMVLMAGTTVRADYDSHPELRPENRCGMIPPGIGDPKDPGGVSSIHCQRLFWDLPATTKLGVRRVSAPFREDRIPRFVDGVTGRVPPMYILDANNDGKSDDGKGYEKPGAGRVRLCKDPDQIGYWHELLKADGSPVIGSDELGYHSVDDPTKPQTGPLYELRCRRGSRAYLGPWQTGTDPAVYDRLMGNQSTRFENTDRLNRDVAAGRTTADKRVEWNTVTEFYNHFSSHHSTCYVNTSNPCSNPNSPQPAAAYDPNNPNAACRSWQRTADPPSHPQGAGTCYAGDTNPQSCSGYDAYRNATQVPGRSSRVFPNGRGILGVEDQLWGCNHHVVTQLPPGSYGMKTLANFRLQKGGIVATSDYAGWGLKKGQVIGGAVGEVIQQYFTEPANAPIKPLNFFFNAIADLATTAYPPFTWNYHESEWVPPYDLAFTNFTIHSHHRMVKGIMDITPASPVRTGSPDPQCGGSKNATATNLYVNWDWEDAKYCEYWKDPDGPVVLRKGQSVRTSCYVNNGVTPEAIKHGLVAGSTVEGLRNAGAPIPPGVASIPTATWADLLVDSPVGHELLYGTHPPDNYRVKYTCGAAGVPTQVSPIGANCSPNPTVDAEGDYVDGPYKNPVECGESAAGSWCNPGVIRFACIGEEEMCIGVGLYYSLPRLGDIDGGHDEAMENLQDGNVDGVGTPGSTVAADNGICHDCDPGL
jgi:hypothetical protein